MIEPLTGREYERRTQRLVRMLDALGDLTVEDRRDPTARALGLALEAPGRAPFRAATFDYRERFQRDRDRWSLAEYIYEYREDPPPGRRAYHWHGDPFHMHCVDARLPARDHHYRGYVVSIFEAHDEFAMLFASGERVSCAGLRPARP